MPEFEEALTMTFQEVIESIGFGRAFYVFRNKISSDYWEVLGYDQLIEIYVAADDRSKLKEKACSRMRYLLRVNKDDQIESFTA